MHGQYCTCIGTWRYGDNARRWSGGQWLTARSTARRERVGRLETARSEPYLTYLNALTELAVGGSDSRELALKLNSVTNQIKLVAGLAGS